MTHNSVRQTVNRAARILRVYSSSITASTEFPWRRQRTTYRIFLAEFLLVRTRSDVVARIFEDVYRRYPTPCSLAEASYESLADALASLGLCKRVPLLIRAARYIVDEFGGEIPSDPDKLICIPGIGPYTASAIAAFAFGIPMVPADVNVLRFLSRLTGLAMEHKTKGSKQLRALLPLFSEDCGGPSPEILLDFTRLICRPRSPLCQGCDLHSLCNYAQAEKSTELHRRHRGS